VKVLHGSGCGPHLCQVGLLRQTRDTVRAVTRYGGTNNSGAFCESRLVDSVVDADWIVGVLPAIGKVYPVPVVVTGVVLVVTDLGGIALQRSGTSREGMNGMNTEKGSDRGSLPPAGPCFSACQTQ
jgi:hypothetical protein